MSQHDYVVEKGGFRFIRLNSGKLISFYDAHNEGKKAFTMFRRSISRAYKLLNDGDYDVEVLTSLIDDVQGYCSYLLGIIEERSTVKAQEERIARLRNVQGRTPEEAAAYRRKADELEARLGVKP